uniref:Uncharacterized protein n=1 Tax=Myoviridae sp. ctq9w2 TaxID=2825177 RepID=A0A8S5PW66_9CAUD|nr:MAG TPA: hypothetical protein [Myoviridae sp. ctq9w2]
MNDYILLTKAPSRLNLTAFSPVLTDLPMQNFGHPSQRKGR